MSDHLIGMWMYKNNGGEAIQNQIIERLRERNIWVINDLDLQLATAQAGEIECCGVDMEDLELYFSYNAGAQSEYQVYLYQMLNLSVPCINSFSAFSLTEDKFRTSHLLHRNGLNTPDYQLCQSDDFVTVEQALDKWGGKAILKPTDGWGGNGIIKIESIRTLEKLLPRSLLANKCYFYLERMVDYDNTDFRIDIVDGCFVGCYGRAAAPGQWKTNICSGGSIMLREANQQLVDIAMRAASLSGLDIAGVDLIYDREYEQYVVLEINGIPAFATPEQERSGLDFNGLKIEKIINLIERKLTGKNNELSFKRTFNQDVA